jgi:hypothetical protein
MITSGKFVQKLLITFSINMRELPKETFTSQRLNCPIKPEGFELPLPVTSRLNAFKGNSSTSIVLRPNRLSSCTK